MKILENFDYFRSLQETRGKSLDLELSDSISEFRDNVNCNENYIWGGGQTEKQNNFNVFLTDKYQKTLELTYGTTLRLIISWGQVSENF